MSTSFSNLQEAPPAEQSPGSTPERPAKKQCTQATVDAHWGIINHPLKEGQQPSTFCILLANTLTRNQQTRLGTMTMDNFGQMGQAYIEGFAWRSFNAASKYQGKLWQKDIGTQPPLHLCKGPGAMVKHAVTCMKGKEIAEAAAKHLGAHLNWVDSGYVSRKNTITMLIIDQMPVFYGNLTYVLQNDFNAHYPSVNFERKTVRIAFAPPPACSSMPRVLPCRLSCRTAIPAGPCVPISSKPSETSKSLLIPLALS